MGSVTSHKTVTFRPVRAGTLPPEFREGLDSDAFVRVSLDVVLDENGFTPDQAASLEEAIRECEKDFDALKSYHGSEELISDLRAGR